MELKKLEKKVKKGSGRKNGERRRWEGFVKICIIQSCWIGNEDEGLGELAERLESLTSKWKKRKGE